MPIRIRLSPLSEFSEILPSFTHPRYGLGFLGRSEIGFLPSRKIITIADVGAGRRGFGYLAKACFGAILYAALFLVVDLPRATVGPELSNGVPLSEAPFFLQLAGGILIGALVLVPLAIASLLTLGYVKLFWRWNWVDEARNPAGMWALRRWFQALVGAFFVAIFAFFFTLAILGDPALGGPAAILAALWNANVFGIVLVAILVLFLQSAAAAGLSVESAQRVRVAVRVELIVLLGTLVSRLYLLWRNWEGFLRDSLLGPSVEPWGVIPAELFTMGTFIVLAAAFRRAPERTEGTNQDSPSRSGSEPS